MRARPNFAAWTTPLLLTLAGGCGGDPPVLLRSPDGRYLLRFTGPVCPTDAAAEAQLRAAREVAPDLGLVLAPDAVARAAARSVGAAAGDGGAALRFVGIGGAVAEGRAWVADGTLAGTVEVASGADTALDLLLLGCRGAPIPRPEVLVGARVFTPGEPDGRRIAAPADLPLGLLRGQHQQLLTASAPAQRFGVVADGDDARRAALQAECDGWGASHPFVDLVRRDAATAAAQAAAIDELVAAKVDAVLLQPIDDAAVAAACRAALAQGIRVAALAPMPEDSVTVVVRADDRTIGRAAADEVRRLLPDGGVFAELGCADDVRARQWYEGLALTLGLERPAK